MCHCNDSILEKLEQISEKLEFLETAFLVKLTDIRDKLPDQKERIYVAILAGFLAGKETNPEIIADGAEKLTNMMIKKLNNW